MQEGDGSMASKDVPRDKRIVIIDRGYGTYDYEREVLEAAGYSIDIFRGHHEDVAGRIAFSQGAPGIMMRWTPIDNAFLDALPDLKAIVRYGVGYEHIDLEAASAHGVKVAIVCGYGNHSVSDHALTLLLSCMRGISLGERLFESTVGHPPRLDVMEFKDVTLGIIGLGRIGGTLSRKVQSLFGRVLAYDPYIPDEKFAEDGAIKCDLDTLLDESHMISIHCNLTEETTKLLGWEQFEKMRQRPVIVNTARGPVIDEQAMLDALHEDRIHSAGLDVFSIEPPFPKLDPLWKHPRVMATCHFAYYSQNAIAAVQRGAAERMLAMLRGETPPDCLNP